MATSGQQGINAEQFAMMTRLAGLNMRQEEIDELKPMYDLYQKYIRLVHSLDFGAEEIGMTFHPEWPAA
jgi:hypothetical protein